MVCRDVNNSYLQDTITPHCDNNDTKLLCSTLFGGLFDPGSSTTWSFQSYSSLSTAIEGNAFQDDQLWGTDTLVVNATFALPETALGIFRSKGYAYKPMNNIGLGTNSTLLSSLVSQGAIGSRSYGYTQGWTGVPEEQQMDGGLILGGYDAARVTGKNITLPLIQDKQYHCGSGLVIQITDIKMNLKNGTDASILGKSQG